MATNKGARDTIVIVAIGIAIASTVVINLLADVKFGRADLTAEKRYSLSQPFLNIIGRLQDPAKLTYYVSSTVPSGFENIKRDILDKFRDIETASNGKIQFSPIDPTGDKELVDMLRKEQAELRLQTASKDQVSMTVLYSALKIVYQNKPAIVLPRVVSAEELEYQLGSQFMELTQEKKPIIAVFAPGVPPAPQMPGRPPQGNGYEWITSGQVPETKKMDLRTTELSETNGIPVDTSLLILIRPKMLSERQRYELTKYIAGGGRVLLLANSFKMSREFGWQAEKTPSGLEPYLKEIGVVFGDDFIADHANLEMLTGVSMFTGQPEYDRIPFFIRILGENIDQESVLTRLMPGILMPIPGEIKIFPDQAQKNGVKLSVLAKTSKQSWTLPFSPTFDPEKERQYDENKKVFEGSKNVFVMADGQFPFPYEGKPVPAWNAGEPIDPKDAEKDKDKKAETASVTKKPGSMVILSCPEAFHLMYLTDRRLGQEFQQNIFLLLNIMEKYSMGEDLLQIRTKAYATRPIDKLAGKDQEGKRNFIKIALVVIFPGLIGAFALVYTMIRRKSQTTYERKFAQTSGPSSFTS